MKPIAFAFAAALALLPSPVAAQSACAPGTYAAADGDFVVLAPVPNIPAPGLRYLFRDGRRGATSEAAAPLVCRDGLVEVQGAGWKRIAFRETPASFDSAGTRLTGVLIEPPGADVRRPLVVMVHGSERTSPIGGVYGYAMAEIGRAHV